MTNSEQPINHSDTHVPVMLDEVLYYLFKKDEIISTDDNSTPIQNTERCWVDGTLGGGGHSRHILSAMGPTDCWIGVDQDATILERTTQQLDTWCSDVLPNPPPTKRRSLHGNFSELPELLDSQQHPKPITGGLLADLGVSSFQLDTTERGFSFRGSAPLDMRMNSLRELTASDILATYSEKELIRIFSDYGEERMSKTIAKAIIAQRKTTPFETTDQLATLIETLYQQIIKRKHFRIHPATCVFQALRIEVNQELQHLETLIQQLPQLLAPGARAVFISFHSLEDRIVKHGFRALKKENGFHILTKKPILPTEEEVKRNPRSRSAKIRVIEAT